MKLKLAMAFDSDTGEVTGTIHGELSPAEYLHANQPKRVLWEFLRAEACRYPTWDAFVAHLDRFPIGAWATLAADIQKAVAAAKAAEAGKIAP